MRIDSVSRVPAMSLSGADEAPEFASRITYEAREDLAKDGSQPAATCNFYGRQRRWRRRTSHLLYVPRLRGTMKRNLLQLTT